MFFKKTIFLTKNDNHVKYVNSFYCVLYRNAVFWFLKITYKSTCKVIDWKNEFIWA